MDPWTARCVSLSPAELKTTKLGPLWRVSFYTDETHGADVTLDYFGLQVITVMMIVDLKEPCAAKSSARNGEAPDVLKGELTLVAEEPMLDEEGLVKRTLTRLNGPA